ncbi:MAG: GNAT family N-acetyltransferase [Jatrophihabitans sp.]
MSSLLRRPAGVASVVELGESDRDELVRLLHTDPIVNAVLAARIHALPSLSAERFGGTLLGIRDEDGRLAAAVFNGGNLLPAGGDEQLLAALGRRLASERRVCTSIVGPAQSVGALWSELGSVWGPCRAMRRDQPLLMVGPGRGNVGADPRVRQVYPHELDAYVPAAAAMFTEELGVSPYLCVASADYRRRVSGLIRDGRAFAVFDDTGEVLFKADLGAISAHTCQVQGVWVRPDLRGRGIGTAGLAAVFAHALTLAPSVSLYVNDFNIAARRMYDTLGMRQIETLSTVLF